MKLLLSFQKNKKVPKTENSIASLGLVVGWIVLMQHVVGKKMGLKPLLSDAGWNTEVAVSNIEKVVDGLSADLYTEVIDWRSMQKMQTAFDLEY